MCEPLRRFSILPVSRAALRCFNIRSCKAASAPFSLASALTKVAGHCRPKSDEAAAALGHATYATQALARHVLDDLSISHKAFLRQKVE